MSTAAESSPPRSGTFRLVVRSADEAVRAIREKLGEHARVVSVNTLPRSGWARIVGAPRFEVVAEVPPPEPPPAPLPIATAGAARRAYAPRDAETGAKLPGVLRRAGFSEQFVGRVAATTERVGDQRPLHEALAELGRDLRQTLARVPARPLPARVAFLGAAGVGRTTALCKWMSHQVFEAGRTGTVWKVEFDRPNPTAALDVFCEALGVPAAHYTPQQMSDAGTGFLLADLPAISRRGGAANQPIKEFLDRERFDGRVLVLNAAYDLEALQAACSAGMDLGATHLVLTHLDEVARWGRLWDFLLQGQLTPLFLSTGPGLAGELETDVIGSLIRHTLPGA